MYKCESMEFAVSQQDIALVEESLMLTWCNDSICSR
jgi:hypothetical protein